MPYTYKAGMLRHVGVSPTSNNEAKDATAPLLRSKSNSESTETKRRRVNVQSKTPTPKQKRIRLQTPTSKQMTGATPLPKSKSNSESTETKRRRVQSKTLAPKQKRIRLQTPTSKQKTSSARAMPSQTPPGSSPTCTLKTAKTKTSFRKEIKHTVINYIAKSRYAMAITLLYRRSQSFRTALKTVLQKLIAKEIDEMCRPATASVWRAKRDKLLQHEQLTWKGAVKEAAKTCPLLLASLKGAGSKSKGNGKKVTNRCISAVLGILVFTRNPYRMKVLQELVGMELWLSGCQCDTFKRLNRLGLTVTRSAAKACIDSLHGQFDQEIEDSKRKLTHIDRTDHSNAQQRLFAHSDANGLENDEWVEIHDDEDSDDEETENGTSDQAEASHEALTPMDTSETLPSSDDDSVIENGKTDEDDLDATDQDDIDATDQDDLDATDQDDLDATDQDDIDALDQDDIDAPDQDDLDATDQDDLDATDQDDLDAPDQAQGSMDTSPNETLPDEYEELHTKEDFGYSLVFGGVTEGNKIICISKKLSDHQLNLVQAYGAVDRVPCMHLDDTPPSPDTVAQTPPELFFPNESDETMLRNEYNTIVSRILQQHIDLFKECNVWMHIPHPYVKESSKKSKLIPLGVIRKDVSHHRDMVELLQDYHQYVPGTTQPIPILLYGDQLACQRVREAQSDRSNELNDWDRLLGVHPSVQEWRKRLQLLEDTYALLYDAESAQSPGALYFIRSRYEHTNVTERVSRCFDHATSLLRFATEAYVIAAACVEIGISSPQECPSHLPEDIPGYLKEICHKIVLKAFHSPELEPDPEPEPPESESEQSYCICKEEIEGEDMLLCENVSCRRGSWFHLSCLGMAKDDIPEGTWHCSAACQKETVKKAKTKPACAAGMDRIYEYSRAILHLGLGEMARHDAIRENDGERILQHWRLDMPHFFTGRHPKYVLEGHHLLLDTNGGVSKRLAKQLTWNRTVNTHGGRGENMEMDLKMKSLNKDYRDAVKAAGRSKELSEKVIKLHGQQNAVKKHIQKVFDRKVMIRQDSSTSHKAGCKDKDTIDLATLLIKHKCLEVIPNRSHTGFEDFVYDLSFDNMDKFKERMNKLTKLRVKQMKANIH